MVADSIWSEVLATRALDAVHEVMGHTANGLHFFEDGVLDHAVHFSQKVLSK